MPIQLTTAISGGDFEPLPLTHAKIVFFATNLIDSLIEIRVMLGAVANGNFVPAEIQNFGTTVKAFTISGSDYSTLLASTASAQGAILYDEVAAALYQWLLTNNHFAGSVV